MRRRTTRFVAPFLLSLSWKAKKNNLFIEIFFVVSYSVIEHSFYSLLQSQQSLLFFASILWSFLGGQGFIAKSRLQWPTEKKGFEQTIRWLLHLGLSLQTTKEPGRRRGGGHKNPKLSLDRDTTGSEIDKITLLKCVPKIGESKFGEWPLLSRLASLKKAFFAAHGLLNFPQSTLLSSVYRHVCGKRGD